MKFYLLTLLLCLGLALPSYASHSATPPARTTSALKAKKTSLMAQKIAKKLERKLSRQARKSSKSRVEFVDIITLTGAVVCVIGVISIIFTILGGLIVAALGLLIYLIGRSQGGEINKIIDEATS